MTASSVHRSGKLLRFYVMENVPVTLKRVGSFFITAFSEVIARFLGASAFLSNFLHSVVKNSGKVRITNVIPFIL